MKQLQKKVQKILKDNGWDYGSVHQQNKTFYVDLYKGSPLGEDYGFTVEFDGTAYDFYWNVKEYYEEFDPEYHASEWYEIGKTNKRSCPHGLRALLNDADAIEKMLEELYIALRREYEGY